MTEVRIRLPQERALALYTQATCDGKITDVALGENVEVSMVPVEGEQEPLAVPSFTETFDTDEGPVEVVSRDCFQKFADYLQQTQGGQEISTTRRVATRAYNTLMRGLDAHEFKGKYVPWGYPEDSKYVLPLGIKADELAGIVDKLKNGSLEVDNLGKGSKAFIYKFAEAFQASREAQVEAVEAQLVGLGSSALATQRHELELRLGQTSD